MALAPTTNAPLPATTTIADPPPVGQQGPCSACTSQGAPGSCVAWSFAYGLGSITANITNHRGINNADHLVSPAFLYEYVLGEQQAQHRLRHALALPEEGTQGQLGMAQVRRRRLVVSAGLHPLAATRAVWA